jgi:hypothetical protein
MEGAQVRVRYGTAADNMLLADLGARTFYDAFATDNTAENMAAYLTTWFSPDKQAAELADPSSVFLIVELESIAVGYARLREGQPPTAITGVRPIEIVRIYVRTEAGL